jgi:hypothetical protein
MSVFDFNDCKIKYTLIGPVNRVFEIDNSVCQSQFLADLDIKHQIPIYKDIHDYYFSQELDKLTSKELVDYLLSDICMINGVIVYIKLDLRITISIEIDDFIKECLLIILEILLKTVYIF